MKPLPLLALLLATACGQAPAQGNQAGGPSVTEETVIMDRIEHDIRLPVSAGAVSSYARYYAWHQEKGGVRNVVAVWQNLTGEQPGRHWVTESQLPVIMDGGCGVVSFSYNAATQSIERVACNGYA